LLMVCSATLSRPRWRDAVNRICCSQAIHIDEWWQDAGNRSDADLSTSNAASNKPWHAENFKHCKDIYSHNHNHHHHHHHHYHYHHHHHHYQCHHRPLLHHQYHPGLKNPGLLKKPNPVGFRVYSNNNNINSNNTRTMFMALSSQIKSHCVTSPGSYDECRTASDGC